MLADYVAYMYMYVHVLHVCTHMHPHAVYMCVYNQVAEMYSMCSLVNHASLRESDS